MRKERHYQPQNQDRLENKANKFKRFEQRRQREEDADEDIERFLHNPRAARELDFLP